MPASAARIRRAVRNAPALAAGRLAGFVLRRVLSRGGSAGPGLVANALSPGLLARMLGNFPGGLIVVTGSSGKSTTAKMLTTLLAAHGVRVFTNASTANLRQGVASALIDQSNLMGEIDADIAVVELDEAVAASMADQLSPRLVVLTNVMLDQLDRFFSAQRVASLLARIAKRATHGVISNLDDQYLCDLSRELDAPVSWFGTSRAVRAALVNGLGYARESALPEPLPDTGTFLLGTSAETATFLMGGNELHVHMPARGAHYGVDAAAAIEAARALLGDSFREEAVTDAFQGMQPVFGRGEVITVHGEEVELLLVQNPSSFQLNLDELDAPPEQILMAVGSDVRDPSWLWSVDTSKLRHIDVVSGSKAYEIATRLAYDNVEIDVVTPELSEALSRFLALPPPSRGHKTLFFTADPMRRIRRQLAQIGERAA